MFQYFSLINQKYGNVRQNKVHDFKVSYNLHLLNSEVISYEVESIEER